MSLITLFLNHHAPLEGVTQGSVIGPLLFTLYTAPLGDIIEAHGLGRMVYMQLNSQIYVVLKRDSDHSVITKPERYFNDIKAWSTANDLKLNDCKWG